LDITASDGDNEIIGNVDMAIEGEEPETSATQPDDSQGTADAGASSEAPETDYSAAPGDTVSIAIPEDVADNPDVDQVVISDLPEGAEVQGGLENADGDTVITGDLSQPVSVNLGDSFEGDTSITMTGLDANDTPVDGAAAQVTMDVDQAHALSGSSADDAAANNNDLDPASGDMGSGDMGDMSGIMDDSNIGDFDEPDQGSSMDDDYSGFGG